MLTPLGLFAVALVAYAAFALPRLTWRVSAWLAVALAVAVGLRVGAAVAGPPLGLKASYWASASTSGVPERSTDFPWLSDATRIETSLNSHGEDFAVHFFNDASRFNFGPDVQPGRDQLPFSVRWEGWLLAPSDGARRFVINAEGPAHIWLDDVAMSGADVRVNVSTGLHTLKVEYTRPEATVPFLRIEWQRQPGGALEALGSDDLRWRPDASTTALNAALGVLANAAFGAVILAWIALGALRLTRSARRPLSGAAGAELWRAGIGLVLLAFLAYGVLLVGPLAGQSTILSGLDDWLIYESSARDILLHGSLMDGGQGHAPPFYGQPLYPYVLALLHRLTGESLFGPIVVQFAALGTVAAGTAVLARRAFGDVVDGLAALAAFMVLLQLEPEHFKIARQLFNENLYMPLVMASLIVVVAHARRRRPTSWWQALLSGVLLGLTAISRSQFLLWIPLALLILCVAWRGQALKATLTVALIALGVTMAILPVTARNLAVSGQLVPITSGGGASLLEFHRPPPGLVDQTALQHDPLYDALHLDQQTRTVVAFVRADPRGYLSTLLPLGAHSIGLQGRNDPGIYWPLLLTVLTYLASFGLRRTRWLHVWPIHAFVGTHLLVLVLFEADTYGYRLVMPMYAPMIAVAAQVPLAGVRACTRLRVAAFMRTGDVQRAARFAIAGWCALVVAALVWQAKGLVDLWPNRETALRGLGGAAAHAALTSDRVGAATIYVASIDGSPRRFGAGSLPGLRYPWFKWFDPVRSLPMPAPSRTAVYMLSEVATQTGTVDLTTCLGPPDASGEVVVSGEQARASCVGNREANGAVFEGLATVNAVRAPASAVAGDTLETQVVWQPLVAHPEPQQLSLQLDDPTAGDGMQWGNGTLELYSTREWQPDELLLSRLPVATDATAIPGAYRLTLGIGPIRAGATPAMATWQGSSTDRVPVSTVTLTPGAGGLGAALPHDMRALAGPPLASGGVELLAVRPVPAEAAVGSPLRVGLLWQAQQDSPSLTRFKLRLVGESGEVVQEAALPLFGGRVAPSSLHAGNVVRDEQSFVVDPRAPNEAVALELAIDDDTGMDASVRLGSLSLTGRLHVFDSTGAPGLATFGGVIELLSAEVSDPSSQKLAVKLRWRAAAEMSVAYKVFVHLLDPTGQRVVAQRDAEPQDGKAPTTSWVVGEAMDDTYNVALADGQSPGDYPVEVGVYDPKSGDRLKLANGDNRLVLNTKVRITR